MTPHRMLLALAASCAAVSRASASSAPVAATVSIWPASLGDALTHSVHDGEIEVQAQGGGGVLAAYSAQVPVDALQASLHPLIHSVKINWVPESDIVSSTFSRVFAASNVFSRADAVGIHLQVEMVDSDTHNGQEYARIEQLRLDVEGSVRALLEQSLPGMTEALQLQRDFLTRSPCDLLSWGSANVRPLFRAGGDLSPGSEALCFASSFPFSSAQTGTGVAFCGASLCELAAAHSDLERSIWSAPRVLSEVSQPRVASISVVRGDHLRVDFSQVHISQTASHTIKIADASLENGVVLISSIRQLQQVFGVEYHAMSLAGDSSSGTAELSVAANTAPGLMAVSIDGEGFHRRMALDLEISDAHICEDEQSQVLLVLPLSHSVYADLDELRRLERFGHFQVMAFQKHIEIERPSPVSPQHVIALQIDMPQTRRLHTELPIHLRYQAPSTTELYRPAVMMAPEAFVYCPSIGAAPASGISERAPANNAASLHFETLWPDTSAKKSETSKTNHWHRVSLDAPIHVQDVFTPAGFLPSQTIVSSVTFASTCVAAIVLVWIAAKRTPQPDAPSSQWRPKRE